MSRRLVVALIAAVVLTLALPAVAQAGGPWRVKDANGTVLGSAKTLTATKGRMYWASGGGHGVMNPWDKPGKWTAYTFRPGYMTAVHVFHAALWHKSPAWQIRGFAEMGPMPLIGRIIKHDGMWVVQAKDSGGWTTEGYVSARCPAWLAGGSVGLFLYDSWPLN
jgi:hypothetical protein